MHIFKANESCKAEHAIKLHQNTLLDGGKFKFDEVVEFIRLIIESK